MNRTIAAIPLNHSIAPAPVTEDPCRDPETPTQASARSRHQLLMAIVLGSIAFLIYNSNMRLVSSGDNYPARYLPFAIWKHGSVYLDSIARLTAQGEADPYWIVQQGDHAISWYPITVPVILSPIYLPAVAYLEWQGWTPQLVDTVARIMEKLCASLIASLSVALMYLLLTRRTNCTWPLCLTIAYGFATNTWMITSQALWQHGMAELFLVVALYVILGPCTTMRAFGLGTVLSLIACSRPPDALFSAALGLYALHWAKERRLVLVAGVGLPLVFLCAYNLVVTHHLAGAYAIKADVSFLRFDPVWGVMGLLLSPARGLLIFSPFLLLLPFCLPATLRDNQHRPLVILILAGIAIQLFLYAKLDWRAGCSWGPRWLTDMLPLLIWLMALGLEGLNRVGRTLLVVGTCIGISIQGIGAYWYTGSSDAVLMEQAGDPNGLSVVWDFRHAPFVAELRHPPAPRDLLLQAEGFVDRVKAEGQDADVVIAGTDLEVQGWSLTNLHTPNAVRVQLVAARFGPDRRPGPYPMVEVRNYLDRPDVTQVRKSQGNAGWQVTLNTAALEPGAYRIEVKVQGSPGGEFRSAAHRPVIVLADTCEPAESSLKLDQLAQLARDRLRSRQSASGFWQTAHTGHTVYHLPQFEMNVYTTALLVDLLTPIHPLLELEEPLARARMHLHHQIEANGLVRYHGRTDAPTLPLLGCVISPDADDTALAWRIAGNLQDARFTQAMETMYAYRNEEGLHRTWLAPRSEYISIEPGCDANPTDVTIQMNVLMLLAQVDATQARNLQQAIQSTIEEDRLWVYYERAPLVPILRETDLANLGFPVRIPTNRRQTTLAGQQLWSQACELLSRCNQPSGARPDPVEIQELLQALGQGKFAAIRTNPPLVYHNDLTAQPKRYYWSPDLGYALWLRLYQEFTRTTETVRLKR